MKRGLGVALFSGLFLVLIILLNAPVHAQGCGIMTQYGPAQDSDCDGVPDQYDNCALIANADQRDMNRNGLGDVCDLLIQEINVNPDSHLRQGSIAHLTARLINNKDEELRDVTVRVRNMDLNIDAIQTISFIPQGEAGTVDFWIPIPKCAAPQQYSIAVEAAMSTQSGVEVQNEPIIVEPGTACNKQGGPLDSTIIDIFNKVDVDRGDSALLPLSITNLGNAQATYDVAVHDYGNWRIDPAAHILLPAGQKSTVQLYLQTDKDAQPGTRTIQVTVTSGNQTTTIPVQLYVRAPITTVPTLPILLQLFFIIFLLALITAAIIIAVRYGRNGRSTNRADGGNNRGKTDTTETEIAKSKKVAVEEADEKVETYY